MALADDVMAMLLAALPWTAMYGVIYFASRAVAPSLFAHCRKLDDATLSYWAASVVSNTNCFVVVPMAWIGGRDAGVFAFDSAFDAKNPLTTLACQAIVGYTMWDIWPIIYYRKEWGSFGMYLVHHIGALSGWGMCAATGIGHNFAVPALLFEATAPFTNGRWFLSIAGLKDTTLYLANGIGMALSFFALRIVYNVYIVILRFAWQWRTFYATAPAWMFVSCYPLYFVNLSLQFLWFSKIFKGILALLGGKPKGTKAK